MKHKLLKHITLIVMLVVGLTAHGQQDPMFTQYMNNPVILNPAYAGSHGALNMNGIFRKQWVGFDWQPTTTSFSISSPFWKYHVGLGFSFVHDNIGPLSQSGVYFDYAYHLDLSEKSRLSLGLKAGFNYYEKDLRGLTTFEDDDWVNQIPVTSKFLFNTGIGAYYFNTNYFIGLSIPKLVRNSLSNDENTYELIGREERHYYLTGGYLFDVNAILKLKPTAMLRIVNGAPASFEITATAILYEQLWAGLTYRVGDAFAAHFRIQINQNLQIGYSYDLNNSRLKKYNAGTHEIFISYTFYQQGRRILSPRYF
ncbi:MAG TPA: type IX secretion system membrane protein PorP/SprF [Prolixibacteraceae bacterium]|nr:type IX secretion system membrane protein PorP/SprF [Prolixibacteraceae bacterium]